MDRSAIVQAYFDAWNAHGVDAVVATFSDTGTFVDPRTSGSLGVT